jgi:hypothetical protein
MLYNIGHRSARYHIDENQKYGQIFPGKFGHFETKKLGNNKKIFKKINVKRHWGKQ